jgi:predicted phage terminase large subunit-like protein
MEIILSDKYKDVFPDAPLVNQNAKREEIWLKVVKRYPSITFVPIGGSMTGRCEASKYIYFDDLVSGFEEAISLPRMEKLWSLYTVNGKQRKLDGCKEIHLATPWSVHDVISKLRVQEADNPRCKIVHIPCFNENKESNFDFNGGFSTKYYLDMEQAMDKLSFNAIYMGEPIEREGLLYNEDELNYYFQLPEGQPDSIISICDSKNLGKDFVSAPIGYVYGDYIYIEDVVYNNGLPEVTRPLVANKWIDHKVVRADVELNNGGNYYAEDLNELIQKKGGKTSLKIFFSGNNKLTKIITYSDFVKKNFVFKHKTCYDSKSEYAKFIGDLLKWTQTGKNKHDDAPDAIAMLAQMFQELNGNSIKFLDRRALGI